MRARTGGSVSIVLVGYHGDDWLATCTSTLANASSERLHLVLVDNAGNHRIDQLPLGRFKSEVLDTPRPMGFAAANNFALVNASHLNDVVIFLNQDTISPAGWIDACLGEFDREERLGAVSPLIRTYTDDGWDPSFLACLDEDQLRAVDGSAALSCIHVKNVPAAALLVRKDVLRKTGPFDPIFGSYYEDYDLCRRIRQAGYRVGFATGARVRHFSGSTTTTRERELERMRLIIRNRFIYELREARSSRFQRVLRRFIADFPRRLARGLARTASSQPPTVTLRAYADLTRIFRRLVSERRDASAWQAYLHEIGWIERFGATSCPPERASTPQ